MPKRKLLRLRHVIALTLISALTVACAQGGGPSVSNGDSTVDQFREYLSLSGIGETWRAGWIAALDSTWRRVAAPYWPASMESEMRDAMLTTDLAPSVWSVYHAYYSRREMSQINSLLRDNGVEGYLASPAGKKFCDEWTRHEEQGRQEISRLTLDVLGKVYDRDKLQIKAARAEYLSTHPTYKD